MQRRALQLHILFAPLAMAAAQPAAADPDLRSGIYDSGSGSSQGKDFKLELFTPVYWTSSVIGAGNDQGGGNTPDWHTAPELSLSWSHQFENIRLSHSESLELDRYREVSSADTNTVRIETAAALSNGKSSVFEPYLQHVFTSYYERDFTDLDDRRHDFWAGFTSDFGFRGGNPIAYRDAAKPGDATLGFAAYSGRRIANDVGRQHWVAAAGVRLGYIVSQDWELDAGPSLRVRWYDDEPGEPERRDVRLSAMARATWTPDWLVETLPDSKLVFSVEYQNNASTDSGAEYETWEIGPALSLAARF